jgi:hypothetical protein
MYHVYADDFQLYAVDNVWNDLMRIFVVYIDGRLKICLFLPLGRAKPLVHHLPVLRLGTIMDERFSWSDQTKVVCRNVHSELWHFVDVIMPLFCTAHASLFFFAQDVDRWNNVSLFINR